MIILHRTALKRRRPVPRSLSALGLRSSHRTFKCYPHLDKQSAKDPRLSDLDDIIKDEFAAVRDDYRTPKHPIILAHGLLGFDELHPAGNALPGIQYWYGITEALATKGIRVITAEVPPSSRIEVRAQRLADTIEERLRGQKVNIIAGLDSRHLISRVKPQSFHVQSLTTIATPHRGSAFADYLFDRIGPTHVPRLYKVLEAFGLDSGAFRQLTQRYMTERFNPRTPDASCVRYYSYGAAMEPRLLSVFRRSHDVIERVEGANDGLVSVASSRWGTYRGTLKDVSHLDLINWTNRLRWYLWQLGGYKKNFNAIALYLDIADMLAKEGL